MKDQVDYWLSITESDVHSMHLLFDGKEYLNAGFYCHLITEKALKANYNAFTGDVPPKIHDLEKLAKLGGIIDILSEKQLKLLERLQPFNIDGRYPSHKRKVADTLNKEICKNIMSETEELLCWIKKRLGKSQ
ncbi:MAG: HEPN domain-containing protein [Ruminococcus sp.]|jgi:HEPN domain-containing protein|nr:HEPN domain-containing protein [Ruminococcus sp.]